MSAWSLEQLNRLNEAEAISVFLSCCNSQRWAESMSQLRPFATLDALLKQAMIAWEASPEEDILEAFSGHAKIGDFSANGSEAASQATQKEQGQVVNANSDTLNDLSRLNQLYLEKFGFIYIVFATGKSATEMLELLQARITNTRNQELSNGAMEQGKITTLRLKQLFKNKNSMKRAPITSHILDLQTGKPASGVAITLSCPKGNQYTATTDDDGRVTVWDKELLLNAGNWTAHFSVQAWFESKQRQSFYSEVSIAFIVGDTSEHYHVPLLINSFGYSTYRGS